MTSPDIGSHNMPESMDFLQYFSGRFENILRWPMLDELWNVVLRDSEHRWYVYAVGEEVPTESLEHDKLSTFIEELHSLLLKDHDHDYCGIVYVDSRQSPKLIKVFDPNNLGTSCGSSGHAVLPGWVISQIQPVDLPLAFPPPSNRRRWWQDLFSS